MDRNREKPPVFLNPFAVWTELAFKMWGLGQSSVRPKAPADPVAVAVIPTSDAPPSAPRVQQQKPAKRVASAAKAARSNAGRTGVAGKRKAKSRRGRRTSGRAGR